MSKEYRIVQNSLVTGRWAVYEYDTKRGMFSVYDGYSLDEALEWIKNDQEPKGRQAWMMDDEGTLSCQRPRGHHGPHSHQTSCTADDHERPCTYENTYTWSS